MKIIYSPTPKEQTKFVIQMNNEEIPFNLEEKSSNISIIAAQKKVLKDMEDIFGGNLYYDEDKLKKFLKEYVSEKNPQLQEVSESLLANKVMLKMTSLPEETTTTKNTKKKGENMDSIYVDETLEELPEIMARSLREGPISDWSINFLNNLHNSKFVEKILPILNDQFIQDLMDITKDTTTNKEKSEFHKKLKKVKPQHPSLKKQNVVKFTR